MKAVAGRKNVIAWAGETMAQAMIVGVAKEHEETGTVEKCWSTFEGFHCARPHGHKGFHFSTMLVLVLPARTVITAVWEV